MTLDSASYIDHELSESFSDIVYSCSVRNTTAVKVSFLFEHKSSPELYPHVQLLKYIANIWEQLRKQEQKPQIVIPIILYHGTKKWRKLEISSYFKETGDEFDPFIPAFEYILVDLSEYTDRQIKEGIFNRVAVKIWLLIHKHIFNPKKLKSLAHIKIILP